MRICFFASDKPREQLVGECLLEGARRHGHTGEMRPVGEDADLSDLDIACFVGVKSRRLVERTVSVGARYIMLDKGYSRHKSRDRVGWEYWRVAIDAHHPSERVGAQKMPHDRLAEIGWTIQPWRAPEPDTPVIFAGSSPKYHAFCGLSEPTTYAQNTVRNIRTLTGRPIIYRPKPSWREAVPVTKAAFSRLPESLGGLFRRGVHVVVTHGSNSCFDAALAGVPSIVLGDGIARPISSTSLGDLETPRLAGDEERLQWAANVAWWQWTDAEFSSGQAWAFLGGQLDG